MEEIQVVKNFQTVVNQSIAVNLALHNDSGGPDSEQVYTLMDADGTILQSLTVSGTEINLADLQSTFVHSVPALIECSNCLQKFGPTCEITKAFLAPIDNEIEGTDIPTTLMEVDVTEALNYIIRWRSFGITFQRPGGHTIQFNDSDTGLCKECAEALARLYSSLRSFEGLTAKESKVTQLTTAILDTIVDLATLNANGNKESTNTQTESTSTIPVSPPVQVHQEKHRKLKPATKFVPYRQDIDMNPVETTYTAADINVQIAEYNDNLDDNLLLNNDSSTTGKILTGLPKKKKKEKEILTYNCDRCDASFKKKTNLNRHLLLTHEVGEGRDKTFKCDHCDRSFHFHYLLKSHQRIHSEDRAEQCPKCPMKFKGKDGLFHHLKDVHTAEEDKPICRICKKTFKQVRSLQEHISMIHRFGKGTAPQPFIPCPNCNSQFKRKRSMLAHLRKGQCNSTRVLRKVEEYKSTGPRIIVLPRRENDTSNYPCAFNCGKYFSRKSSMMSHVTHLCPLKPKEEFEFDEESVPDIKYPPEFVQEEFKHIPEIDSSHQTEEAVEQS